MRWLVAHTATETADSHPCDSEQRRDFHLVCLDGSWRRQTFLLPTAEESTGRRNLYGLCIQTHAGLTGGCTGKILHLMARQREGPREYLTPWLGTGVSGGSSAIGLASYGLSQDLTASRVTAVQERFQTGANDAVTFG